MNVRVARTAMGAVLEMVVLDIGERVAHRALAADDLLRPDPPAVPLDRHDAVNQLEVRVEDKLRTDRAGSHFGVREVKIVAALRVMIGEFVSDGHPDAPRLARIVDDVDPRDFGLLAAVLTEFRYD